jgi:hypothetical protein
MDVKKQYEEYKQTLISQNELKVDEFDEIDKELESVDLSSKLSLLRNN